MPDTTVAQEIRRKDSVRSTYECSWNFDIKRNFRVEGDEDLVVEQLELITGGDLLPGNKLWIRQSLVGSSRDRNDKRGLFGLVGIAYTGDAVLREGATSQDTAQSIQDYHQSTVGEIEKAYEAGMLPRKIVGLERI